MDCTLQGKYGNYGCNGGWARRSFMYSDINPIELASDYPYISGTTKVEGPTCNHQKDKGKVSAEGFSTSMWTGLEQLIIAV